MLGVSGMRGIVGKSLTPEVALRYAAAFGGWLRERDRIGMVAVARDGRRGGEAIYEAAIAGLLGAGCAVTRLGVAATPTVGRVAADLDGAIIVTASHNPQAWNGLKLLLAGSVDIDEEPFEFACAPPADIAAQIIERFHGEPRWETAAADRPLEDHAEAAYEHWMSLAGGLLGVLPEALLDRWNDTGSIGLRFVVDAVNSSGSTIAVPFLDYLGGVVPLHCGNSGVFPHTPEPTRENLSGAGGLCSVVPGVGAAAGFAQDPDADRLAIVDETGAYIGEEYTFVLAALALLEHDRPDDAVLVANLSTSRMIDDVAARFGARVERTPVGEAHVVQRMIERMQAGDNVILGGEGNGGVIWPSVCFVRDSLSAMALTVLLLCQRGRPLSEIVAEIPRYAIIKRTQPLARKSDAEPAIEAVAEAFAARGRVDRQDGVRVDLEEQRAWFSVRASNTEPILRLIAEAPDEATAAALLDEAAGLVPN